MQAFLDMLSKFFEVFESGNSISFSEMIPEITDQYMILLFAVLFLIVGVLQCFLGFRFFKVWCSFIGLILGSVIGMGVTMLLVPPGEVYSEYIRIFFILCIGLICAFAAYRAYLVGVFLYAFCILFALCFIPLSTAFDQIMIGIIVGLCVGIAAGVVAVIVQRISIITATCLSGGLAVATGVIILMGDGGNIAFLIVPIIAALACAGPGFFVQMATTKPKVKTDTTQPVVQVIVQSPAEAAAAVTAATAAAKETTAQAEPKKEESKEEDKKEEAKKE